MQKVVQKRLFLTTWKTIILGTTWTVAALAGCKKADIKQEQAVDHKYQPSLSIMSATLPTFEPNTMSWTDLGIGYDDQNTRYNKAKLYLAIGLTEVVKDSAITAWMVAEAKQHEDNVFYFDNLFARFPQTKTIMEATIDPLGEKTGWTFERVQQEMQYENFDIKASIYLTNTDIANASQKAMVTPGYDVMQEDESHPSDVLLGFYINQQNEVSRINLWKEIVEGVTAPIFAIDGRATNKPPLVITGVENPTGTDTVPVQSIPKWRISVTQFQIGYRYENSGKSEYAIAGKCLFFPYAGTVTGGYYNSVQWPGNSRDFLREDCGALKRPHIELASVTANTINNWTPVSINKYFCWMGVEYNNFEYSEYDTYPTSVNQYGVPTNMQTGRKKLYYNTFENDGWGTSYKPLSPASINGIPLGLKGQMGSYNEWYQVDPYNAAAWLPANTFYANKIFIYNGWEWFNWGPVSKGGWSTLKITTTCP